MPSPSFIIHTGRNGKLDRTTVEDIDVMMKGISETGKVVIHLHGGLVNQENARAKADELLPAYQGTNSHPVFFIYETGLLEIVRNNLDEIASEKLFKLLLGKILQFAKGKMGTPKGAKGFGGIPLPSEIEIGRALAGLNQEEEPFDDFEVVDEQNLTEEEELRFREELSTNVLLQQEIQAVVNSAADFEEIQASSKGFTISHKVSKKTLMSPLVVEEIVDDAKAKQGKGILSTATFLFRAVKVLNRVIKRFQGKRDHGLYTTVVEELLRELYIDNAGAAVWGAMKKETEDTFDRVGDDEIRGGWYFVRRLGEVLKENPGIEVSIVAHSLGSVFACNLIDHVASARENADHPLPSDFKFSHVIFLAPAVTHERFAQTLASHAAIFPSFRVFNLSDALEAGYWEVPVIYPRSLLYLVAGLLEVTQNGDEAIDKPLLGMERYLAMSEVYHEPEVAAVGAFLAAMADSIFYSEIDSGAGKATDALKHGGFDNWDLGAPRKTMESVSSILS